MEQIIELFAVVLVTWFGFFTAFHLVRRVYKLAAIFGILMVAVVVVYYHATFYMPTG
jgi:hypothetical protein